MARYSLHHNLFRSRSDRKSADEDSACSTPLLASPSKTNHAKFSSLPTPPVSPCPSTPSVVFPTKITPPTSPTSLRKRALTVHMGCRSNSLDDDDVPFEPKHQVRCPTLNMLKNIGRTGSPAPRVPSPEFDPSPASHGPAASSRASSPVQISRPPSSVEIGRTAVSDPFPPVLTLPNEGSLDDGLGWADEFGIIIDTRVAPPRPWSTTFSHSSRQTSWSQPSRPPSRHSFREYPTSSTGFFSSNSGPLAMPSATAVLEAAESCSVAPSPLVNDSFVCQEDFTSREVVPTVRFREHCEASSPPPRLGFQLRRSPEDWATAVLKAVGTPIDA